MLSVLKTILNRLEKIEKQLEVKEPEKTKSIPVQSPPPRIIETNINEVRTEAKAILIEAKDEAFRIKREAEEESRKIRQEALTIEQKIIAKEENIDIPEDIEKAVLVPR